MTSRTAKNVCHVLVHTLLVRDAVFFFAMGAFFLTEGVFVDKGRCFMIFLTQPKDGKNVGVPYRSAMKNPTG